MNIYIIDYENVQSGVPLCGLEQLKSCDEVYLFYSDNAKKISEYYWKRLMAHPCGKHFYKLKQSGKNALDFCISMEAGRCLGRKEKPNLAIISSDTGYKALAEYYPQITGKSDQRLIFAGCIGEAASLLDLPPQAFTAVQAEREKKVSIGAPVSKEKLLEKQSEQKSPFWNKSLRLVLSARKIVQLPV